MIRRGFALPAVLVIVAAAILAVTGTVFLVRGEVAGTAHAGTSLQLRALAWSGVQAVAASIAAERGELLQGESPRLESPIVLWEADGVRGEVRLLPLGPAGELAVSENARIDFAALDAEALVASGLFTAERADAIVAARDRIGGRPLDLAATLGAGLDPVALYGDPEEAFLSLFADPDSDDDAVATAASDAAAARARGLDLPPRGLVELATPFALDPPLRADGSPRLPAAGPWDAEARSGLDAALGEGSASLLERLVGEASDGRDLLRRWCAVRRGAAERAALLEWIAWEDEGFAEGRLDLLRASEAALRCVPGLDEAAAARIVRERDAVPAADRTSLAWLLAREILDDDAFVEAAPRLTTRSLFWRVRVEARLVPTSDDPPSDGAADPGERVILEAVLDLTAASPRVTSLRDITALPDALRLLAALPPVAGPEETDEEEAPSPSPPAFEPTVDPAPVRPLEPAPPAADGTVPAIARPGAAAVGRWKRAG